MTQKMFLRRRKSVYHSHKFSPFFLPKYSRLRCKRKWAIFFSFGKIVCRKYRKIIFWIRDSGFKSSSPNDNYTHVYEFVNTVIKKMYIIKQNLISTSSYLRHRMVIGRFELAPKPPSGSSNSDEKIMSNISTQFSWESCKVQFAVPNVIVLYFGILVFFCKFPEAKTICFWTPTAQN